jgi:hypothetical protein
MPQVKPSPALTLYSLTVVDTLSGTPDSLPSPTIEPQQYAAKADVMPQLWRDPVEI